MNKKLLPVYWLALIQSIISIALNAYFTVVKELHYRRLASLFIVIALVCALVYVLKGFKKENATQFKLFLFFYLLSEFVMIFTYETPKDAFAHVVVYGLLVALCSIKDLGDKKSYVVSGVILLLQVFAISTRIFMTPGVFRGGTMIDTIFILQSCSKLLMAFILVCCIYGKYTNKKLRGAK